MKGEKAPKIKIAQVPEKSEKGILKAKTAPKANSKKEVKIYGESSGREDQSEYSSDAVGDSSDEKSKRSSVQALSGDEDIDQLY